MPDPAPDPVLRVPEARDLTGARRPPGDPGPERHVLTGWGESCAGWARVRRPRSAAETAALLRRFADEGRPLALRGAGRSYGDAALLSAGDVLDLTALRRVRSFDPATGLVEVESGVTFEDLWRTFLPRGYWSPVVPGTMYPTLGGAFAMNVHGKNHFRAGGFSEHVESVEVVFPGADPVEVRADRDEDLFRALAGGAGLLGVVTSLKLRLKRVHSGDLDVTAFATPSFAAMLEEFARLEATSDYVVGWIDGFDALGRGVVHAANHVREGADANPSGTLSLAHQGLPPRILGVVPRGLVAPLMTPLARPAGMRAINAAKYRAAAVRGRHVFRDSHVRFAYLLDYVPGWKRIYEPGGLIQYQRFVPREQALAVHGLVMQTCRRHRIVPWLCVLKRHRPCATLLAHALDGYSLALDFPVTASNREELWKLCRDLDETVLASGGRIYLAKDLTATPAAARRAFPGLPRFGELKKELDPAGVLTSDLARRLRLFEPTA